MNILEAILSAQGGAPVRQMGARVGVDEGQARSALEALLPMLAGAVNRNATQPGGLEALLGALSDGHHQRYLDDPSSLTDEVAVEDGNAILGHLFGSKEVSREVASRASAQTGLGADVLKRMLPIVAAMLMGGLSKGALGGGQGDSGGLDGVLGGGRGGSQGGLGDVLGSVLGGGSGGAASGFGRPGSQGGLLDMLTPMLDRNRDGSALDDILGMASQFLGKR
ncbi:DUF937 domain-containing protein [Zeimonas arvi]|uniref:DUF937 domain-containing protein n=1 Tax=Zeimonas arvi TaxID=2498847 RepID=UPI00164F23BF|nr:DUF937 domain-containing protein [Zeimonas arvi]